MSYLEAKYVTLTGNMTIGGMNTRNFDALRDQCVLHLHQETGGVLVKRGEDVFFISPVAITSVELFECPDLRATSANASTQCMTLVPDRVLHETKVPKAMLAPRYPVMTAEEEEAEKVRVGARNLADEVLAELGEGDSDLGTPAATHGVKAVTKRRAAKKG